MNCPECKAELSAEAVAKLAADSRIVFAITPAPGELFDVKTVSGSLMEFGKLLVAIGKDLCVKTLVLLERAEMREDGGIAFHCIVCRHGSKKAHAANAEDPQG